MNAARTPMVVLRHETPDGRAHYDWLIARQTDPGPDPNRRSLLSLRCDASPAEAERFEAALMPDHRVLYLTFEGEVAGGRGVVRRAASGWAAVARADERRIEVWMEPEGGPPARWVGERIEGGATPAGEPVWRFRRVGEASPE